jgi:hypothetical protein
MSIMYKITKQQANELRNLTFDDSSYYYPIQDVNNDWFISETEVNKSNIAWVKELQPSNFEPKIIELP